MLIIVSLLLVTMALSAVMLLVLSSLRDSGARGIREWFVANAMAVVSLPLFAARGVLPDVLSIELANTLLLGTTAMMLAGFRRHLVLPVPWRRLGGCIVLGLLVIVVLHHGVDSTGGRMVAMSLLHAVLCLEMGVLLRPQLGRPRAATRSCSPSARPSPTPPCSWCAPACTAPRPPAPPCHGPTRP
jgi:hypothetical protein